MNILAVIFTNVIFPQMGISNGNIFMTFRTYVDPIEVHNNLVRKEQSNVAASSKYTFILFSTTSIYSKIVITILEIQVTRYLNFLLE
jgi:hypothetical protein